MGVTVVDQLEPLDPNDIVFRQRLEHAARVAPRDEFRSAVVHVELGPLHTRYPITLKYALNSHYVFAVFAENPAFHDRDREEWSHVADNALEKFAAVRGLQIKLGPRPEDMQPRNRMVECDKPIAVSSP